MQRETIFTAVPAKHFESEDRPLKSKKAIHLLTYSNFLVSDLDHSQDRPFSNMSPERKRKSFQSNDFHINRDHVSDVQKPRGKRRGPDVNQSNFDPLKFSPDYGNSQSEIKRKPMKNNSNLIGSTAQPIRAEEHRACKKKESFKYQDGSGVKSSLTYE